MGKGWTFLGWRTTVFQRKATKNNRINDRSGGKEELGRLLPFGIAGFLLFSMVSISISQIFLGMTLLIWIISLFVEKRTFSAPGFFWPLAAYAFLSLLSSLFSVNPRISLWDSREMLMILLVPLISMGYSRVAEIPKVNTALLASGLLGLAVFVPFLMNRGPGARFRGFAGHYMTEAGLLLLFCVMAVSLVLFSRMKIRWLWGAAAALSLVFLAFTLTRSSWVGLGAGMAVLLFLYKPKALLLLPILAAAAFALSPGPIRARALSIFDPKNPTNAIRFEYIRAGIRIIKEYPLLGTGPDTVDLVFQHPKYGLSPDARDNVHLHNNLIQIAAERGLFTLAAWLIFLIWAFVSLAKRLHRIRAPDPYAAAALAALAALFTAGLFEYNFSDSEITALFFYIISIPWAHLRLQGGGDRAGT
jgi:O-antigen ligase